MAFSIISPKNVSTIMAEITLAQTQEQGDTEGLTLPQEFIDPEMLNDFSHLGCLRGESKSFAFILQESTSFSQKLTDYISDINPYKGRKNLDKKDSKHSLSFKESLIHEKVLKVIDLNKQNVNSKEGKKDINSKTQQSAQRSLEKAILPKTPAQLKETSTLKQQQNQAQSLQQKIQAELFHKEQLQNHARFDRKADSKPSTRENTREMAQLSNQKLDKNEERQQEEQKHKRDEEGFAEGQKDSDKQQPKDQEEKKYKVERANETFVKEFVSYSAEESILSELFKLRVSQFDVLILFIEILKLEIRNREQEKLARRQERELQILHMQKVVDNYKSQGKWAMFSGLGSGILAIVSGICPIIGQMKEGDWILQKLGGVFSGLRDVKKDQFFKGATKITFAMSEMYKSTEQIQRTFAEGSRTLDQHLSDLHRTDWEENTRSMEEIKDHWKGIENFLYQALQMYHESIRQLYSH